MEIRWTAKSLPNQEIVARLSKELNVSEPMATILVQREIDTFEKAKNFFRPALSELHDPYLMKDMELAYRRIKDAIKAQESLMVYGDYDVDGTTAVSLVYSYFKTLNQNIEYYIPDRYKEGYGISKMGIDHAKTNGVTLIIALDCGIRSNELVDYAKSIGIDFIICDHHLPGAELPNAVAILNPKRKDCDYPYKELSGAGIGFKLLQGYSKREGFSEDKAMEYIDLVAVSIAADMVDMRGENRILAYYGLKKLNENPSLGLQALMDGGPKKQSYSIQDIVFGIGPKINAAGRISDAKAAVRVLIETEYTKAMQLSRVLNDRNDERKELDTDITKTAIELINSHPDMANRRSVVIKGDEWHKGVIGIVASRMVEQYYKPTIVFSLNDGMLTGSARSVKNFDIHEAITQCSDLVEQFGGHKYAAGLSVKAENFDAFVEKFEGLVARDIQNASLTPEVEYDLEIDIDSITPNMMKLIGQMSPFGPGNPQPIFMSQRLKSNNSPRILKDKHLKLQLQQNNSRFMIDGIGFGLAEQLPIVTNGAIFDACYCIEENFYNGQVKLQLRLRDLRNTRTS
ncbi:MAG: single-stranded-DNA-specific exonuclease RecJ [Bacteroidia bacterium]|nr:single-stranded-DNA-specific exonuclease RecJ [Bacteroidia bacterium]